ncbi:hypothetical protein C8R47DRAFT_1137835 [Mycena vitilis]|nr:hypothetical protein C8R47DRAFT_1137776 [Mycena vitilis]KAJ6479326.1 hypothetical protein C8R47DRAFT_1137835 [Mycena vitilis]
MRIYVVSFLSLPSRFCLDSVSLRLWFPSLHCVLPPPSHTTNPPWLFCLPTHTASSSSLHTTHHTPHASPTLPLYSTDTAQIQIQIQIQQIRYDTIRYDSWITTIQFVTK